VTPITGSVETQGVSDRLGMHLLPLREHFKCFVVEHQVLGGKILLQVG
jgi:hypothetical protein